jgi:hypothetical protein
MVRLKAHYNAASACRSAPSKTESSC